MGTERAPNQRPSHDLHPMQFLQFHGGRGPVSLADMLDEDRRGLLPQYSHR